MGHSGGRHIHGAYRDTTSLFMSLIGPSLRDVRAFGLAWADLLEKMGYMRVIERGEVIQRSLVKVNRPSIKIRHLMTRKQPADPAARLESKIVRFEGTRPAVPNADDTRSRAISRAKLVHS
jgi:hypothetical protein